MKTKHFHNLSLIIFLILLVFITWQSLLPQPYPIIVENVWDKLLHFIAWFILSALLIIGLYKGEKLKITKNILLSLIALFIYSCLIEALQGNIPNRFPSALDALANGLGISFAGLLFYIPKKRFN